MTNDTQQERKTKRVTVVTKYEEIPIAISTYSRETLNTEMNSQPNEHKSCREESQDYKESTMNGNLFLLPLLYAQNVIISGAVNRTQIMMHCFNLFIV
jgi:hypothetical protein